jgi:hypothetical protein
VKQPDETFIGVMRALDSYEKMSPEDMEKSAEFWSTALGSEFSWATTGDLRRLTSCTHVDFHKPQIFISHLNRKNHVDCVTCGMRRIARNAKNNPDRCDQCGTKAIDEFYAFIAQAGMFLVLGEICLSCKDNHKETISSLFTLTEDSVIAPDEGEKGIQNESQDS